MASPDLQLGWRPTLRVQLAPAGVIAPARYGEAEWARLRAARARAGWPSRWRGDERIQEEDDAEGR